MSQNPSQNESVLQVSSKSNNVKCSKIGEIWGDGGNKKKKCKCHKSFPSQKEYMWEVSSKSDIEKVFKNRGKIGDGL